MNKPEIDRKRHILIWTEAMDAFVDHWRDRRKSFGWIAKELGISRCAVIGRSFRRRRN
jgi:hypothetical protein